MKTFKIHKDEQGDRYVMVTKQAGTVISVNFHQGLYDLNGNESIDFKALSKHDEMITEMYKAISKVDPTMNPLKIMDRITYGIIR